MVMTAKTRAFIDEYIMRQVQLHRVFEGQAAKQARKIKEIHDKVLAKLIKDYGSSRAANLREMSKQITDEIIAAYVVEIIPDVKTVADQVIIKEVNWNVDTLNKYANKNGVIPIDISIKKVNALKIAKTVASSDFHGRTFDDWFDATSKKSARMVRNALVAGYVNGATTQEITSQVAGILNRGQRDVVALTRSYLSSAAYESRMQTFKGNGDILEGFAWVSTLDSRTTPLICGIRDGLLYDLNHEPIGHEIPWEEGPGKIHFNCRSTFVPKLPGFDFETTRPAVGAGPEYERGDNLTATGKVRKPTKANRDNGIYKVTQVNSSTDYESFLKRQPKDFVADVLGSEEKAAEFLSGKKSLLNFATETTSLDVNSL